MKFASIVLLFSLQCVLLHAKAFNDTKKSLDPAQPCDKTKCQLPTCHCAGTDIPGGIPVYNTPQIVMISFDDAFRVQDFNTYYSPLFSTRKNPNGCQIGLTYFVSHNYTDYSLVEHAYCYNGAEFADHSVTHREPTTWWEKATEEEWTHEIMDQKSILNVWGNVPKEEIRGFRSPFLVTSETEIKVLHDNGFLYEATMGSQENYWPFTLDYKSPICNAPATCPVNSYPGLWLVPNIIYKQSNGFPCSMLDGCTAPVTEEDWVEFFDENFSVHYNDNRSPFGIYSHSAWLYGGSARINAMKKFLDKIASMKDVYIVTHAQMLEWVRKPTPLDQIHEFEPWKCPSRPTPRCNFTAPSCHKTYPAENNAILNTCSTPCPANYPGYGNPDGH